MKIINNRYKIEKMLRDKVYCESYLVSDLLENDEKQYMKLYNSNTREELINYYEDNFIHLSSISHQYLIASKEFKLVNSIDAKKTNMQLYYYISEYFGGTRLVDFEQDLSLKEKLRIILDIILVMDYLHFRGITYKLLNPYNIFISKDKSVKIADIATIIEKSYYENYDDLARTFMAAEVLLNYNSDTKKVDYYSIGMLLKYLLLEDFSTEKTDDYAYKEQDLINTQQKEELNNIISELTKNGIPSKELRLINIIDRINDIFNLNYSYDLVESRDKLFFENSLIGREKEISQLMKIDEEISQGTNNYRGFIVEADFGIGKSRFLREVARKLELRGRDVYFIEANDSGENDLLDMANILKQSIKDTPSDILDKYRTELSTILPELRLYVDDNKEKSLDERRDRFRLYNRISNYFNDLSKDKVIYIIIDDLQKCNHNFLILLDYLINNISSNNLFFIFSFEDTHRQANSLAFNKQKEWEKKSFIKRIQLHKFDLEEIGMQVKNILGISYIPYELATVLLKESNGNARYVEYIIKHLYSIGEMYMNVSGYWYVKPDNYSDLYFPADIEDAFEKQINIIKEKYLDIFKIMSVFQDVLYKKTLINMMDIDEGLIEEQINELKALKLIDKKLADWGYSYNINSGELKKLIYYEMSDKEKIVLHRKAAQAIEDTDGEKLDTSLEELIYHLIKSNQNKKALKLILNKIDKLENKYSAHARLLLEKGLALVDDTNDDLKLEILGKIVEIYSKRGESEKGNAYLEEYLDESTRLNDHRHIIKGKSAIVDTHFHKAQNSLAIKEIEEIKRISDENNIVEGKINALASKARINIRSGKIEEAEKQLLQALDISEEHHVIDYMGIIYHRLGLVEYLSGNLDKAIILYEKSVAYYEKTEDFIGATRPINNIANIYGDQYGDSERAMESYKKGYEIASKFGVSELEIVFLINISNTYSDKYEFEKAIEYLEAAKKGALELQDLNMIFYIHISFGSMYLIMSEYSKAYESYQLAKRIFETKQITDVEITSNYHNFLGQLFEYMGEWDKAIEYSYKSSDLCKEFSSVQYLEAQSRILRCKFLKDSYFNRDEIEAILKAYRNTKLVRDRREAILYFSIIAFIQGDQEYSLDLIKEDKKLIKIYDIGYLNKLRNFILSYINPTEEAIDKLIKIEESSTDKNYNNLDLYINKAIGYKLYSNSKYKEALKFLLEALDTIYRATMRIPNDDWKLSYIASMKGDEIKEKISSIIEKEYNSTIDDIRLKDIQPSNLYDYFDITPLIDIIGSEDFVKVIQLDYYGEALDVNDIQTLLSRFKDNYKYNLDLILSFLGKETLAKKGYVLRYDEEEKDTVVISYLGNDPHGKLNMNLIKMADRSKEGFYVESSLLEEGNYKHMEFLTEEIKGIICVPIRLSKDSTLGEERRKPSFDESINLGYIYLETDRMFNRFDAERFKLVRNLANLVSINLSNYNLQQMATMDKLTGTLTRKYYEAKFDELINIGKSTKGYFSVLMVDIDRFKRVNDNYGHRKGDEVLKIIGDEINSTIRSSDIVARYGGEEFVILVKNTFEEEAYGVAEKIRKNIKNLNISGVEYPITVSIGISLFPQHSQFKEELVEKADQSLYYAKETGRDKVALWNAEMSNTLNRVDKLAGILTGNIDEDNRNALALMDIIELIKEENNIDSKVFRFLGRIVEAMDAEYSTLIYNLDNKDAKKYRARTRFNNEWVETPLLNEKIIKRVMESNKGEFLIDWENLDNIDPLSGLPNWQSIIVQPLVKDGAIKGILYISSTLKNKEFNFSDFNLSKTMASIFASVL